MISSNLHELYVISRGGLIILPNQNIKLNFNCTIKKEAALAASIILVGKK